MNFNLLRHHDLFFTLSLSFIIVIIILIPHRYLYRYFLLFLLLFLPLFPPSSFIISRYFPLSVMKIFSPSQLQPQPDPLLFPAAHRYHLLSVLAPKPLTKPVDITNDPEKYTTSLSISDALALLLSNPRRPAATTVLRRSLKQLEVYICAAEYESEEVKDKEERFMENVMDLTGNVVGKWEG